MRGDKCKAVFFGDGGKYDAVVERLDANAKKAWLRFVGYEEEDLQITPFASMFPLDQQQAQTSAAAKEEIQHGASGVHGAGKKGEAEAESGRAQQGGRNDRKRTNQQGADVKGTAPAQQAPAMVSGSAVSSISPSTPSSGSSAPAPSGRSLKRGDKVKAKFADDGQFYDATIVGISAKGFSVVYKGYEADGAAIVDFDDVRQSESSA